MAHLTSINRKHFRALWKVSHDGAVGEITVDCIRPSLYRERWPVSRKAHRCSECRMIIPLGVRYRYIVGVWDGDFTTFRQCPTCAALFDMAYHFYNGDVAFGELDTLVDDLVHDIGFTPLNGGEAEDAHDR